LLLYHNFCLQEYNQHGQEEDDTPVSDLPIPSSSTVNCHMMAAHSVLVVVAPYFLLAGIYSAWTRRR
jgi:hypothetical protein